MAVDSAKKALEELSFSMSIDPGFAWTWHCNVAMVAIDAGAPHKEANERAADFMRRAFGVDTSKPPIEPESSNAGGASAAGNETAAQQPATVTGATVPLQKGSGQCEPAASAATSETPETDGESFGFTDASVTHCMNHADNDVNGYFVKASFARDLERRLSVAEMENKTLARNNRWLNQTTNKELIALGKRAEAAEQELATLKKACDGLPEGAIDGGWTAAGLSAYAQSLEKRLREIEAERNDAVLKLADTEAKLQEFTNAACVILDRLNAASRKDKA